MVDGLAALTARQRALLTTWLPNAECVRDHSWGLVGTTVLELSHDDVHYIVKAGDHADHHLARELRAHEQWLEPWTSRGVAPRLIHADGEAKILLREHLDGHLVEGAPEDVRCDTYAQAGRLLALLHGQLSRVDETYEANANATTLRWLESPHAIAARDVSRVRAEVASWPTPVSVVVPTHGDWQPRNWLVHNGEVRVIDFGRADVRPAFTDLTRLAAQQFRGHPERESAFLEGYGGDPREPDAWRREQLRAAVSTTAWAHQVSNSSFERQGLRMMADALDG